MQQIIDVVTEQSFLTFVLVIITAYYAYWTKKVVETTFQVERMRKQPAIVASVSRSRNISNSAYVVIENYGLSPAFNISFNVEDDFYLWPPNKNQNGGSKFSELLLVQKGFRVMAPKQKIQIPAILIGDHVQELRQKPRKVLISYKDSYGNEFNDELHIDFASLPDHSIGEPEDKKARKALDKIAQEIKSLTNKVGQK